MCIVQLFVLCISPDKDKEKENACEKKRDAEEQLKKHDDSSCIIILTEMFPDHCSFMHYSHGY